MNAITADPSTADVTTSESTTSTSYTDLSTAGPAVTLTLVNGQTVLVLVSARMNNSTGGPGFSSYFSFAVSGGTTISAADAAGGETQSASNHTVLRATVITASSGASHTFTMKYRVTAATGNYFNRRIVVKKW